MPGTIVHRASPAAVQLVLHRLHEGGVDAIALDDPNPIALFVSFGTYRVRVAVPEEEADEARRILDEWDREARPRLSALARRMRRQFLAATLGALAVAAGLRLAGVFAGEPHWLLLVLLPLWFGLLLVAGAVDRARERV